MQLNLGFFYSNILNIKSVSKNSESYVYRNLNAFFTLNFVLFDRPEFEIYKNNEGDFLSKEPEISYINTANNKDKYLETNKIGLTLGTDYQFINKNSIFGWKLGLEFLLLPYHKSIHNFAQEIDHQTGKILTKTGGDKFHTSLLKIKIGATLNNKIWKKAK